MLSLLDQIIDAPDFSALMKNWAENLDRDNTGGGTVPLKIKKENGG